MENSPQLQWQIALAEADKTGGTEKIRELLRSGLSLDKRNRAALADLLELKKFGGEREGKLGLNRTAEQQEYLRAMVEFFRLSESDGPLSRVQQMVAARVQKFGESEADALAHVMASTDGVAAYEQDELEKAGRALEQAGATF